MERVVPEINPKNEARTKKKRGNTYPVIRLASWNWRENCWSESQDSECEGLEY